MGSFGVLNNICSCHNEVYKIYKEFVHGDLYDYTQQSLHNPKLSTSNWISMFIQQTVNKLHTITNIVVPIICVSISMLSIYNAISTNNIQNMLILFTNTNHMYKKINSAFSYIVGFQQACVSVNRFVSQKSLQNAQLFKNRQHLTLKRMSKCLLDLQQAMSDEAHVYISTLKTIKTIITNILNTNLWTKSAT